MRPSSSEFERDPAPLGNRRPSVSHRRNVIRGIRLGRGCNAGVPTLAPLANDLNLLSARTGTQAPPVGDTGEARRESVQRERHGAITWPSRTSMPFVSFVFKGRKPFGIFSCTPPAKSGSRSDGRRDRSGVGGEVSGMAFESDRRLDLRRAAGVFLAETVCQESTILLLFRCELVTARCRREVPQGGDVGRARVI
jgi:hypothetical protein